MSRSLTAATAAASRADVAYPVYFVEMHFRSETSRAWTGVGSINWNGEAWQGTGQFGRVSAIEETTELRIAGITLELSGVDPTLIAAAMDRSEYKRREGAVWMGFTDQSGRRVVVSPFQVFAGRMDRMTVQDGATATIQVTMEHDLADLERVRARRYTDADQRLAYPDDKGLEFIESIQDRTLEWPNG